MQRAYVLTILPPVTALTVGLPAQRAIAQRFSALARMRDMPLAADDVRFRGKTGSSRYVAKTTRMVESRCGAVAVG